MSEEEQILNGCYTFVPKSNVNIKVIVINNTAVQDAVFDDDFATMTTGANGYFTQERFDWLIYELGEAKKKNELIIVAAHIPFGVGLWNHESPIKEEQIVDLLNSNANVIALMAGHRHLNSVQAFPSNDPKKPELGFWQIETASLRDFAQQFRIFDIRVNDNGTVSLQTIVVDPIGTEDSLMSKARSLAIATDQIFPAIPFVNAPTDPSRVYNAELYIMLSPEMIQVLK